MTDYWGRMGALGSWLGAVILALIEWYVLTQLPVFVEQFLFPPAPAPPPPEYPSDAHPLEELMQEINRLLAEISAELKAVRAALEARDSSARQTAEGLVLSEQAAQP